MGILKLGKGEVAVHLAERSYSNGWAKTEAAQDLEVLRLRWGVVAWWLAENSADGNRWAETPAAQNLDVVKLYGGKVAEILGVHSDKNKWGMTDAAQRIGILRLCGGKVVYELMKRSPGNGWGKSFMGMFLYCFVLFKNYIRRYNCWFFYRNKL